MNQIVIGFMMCAQLTTLPAINVYKLADAIYKTEGSYGTSWPSGTINNWKSDTTRQDCLNIIRRQARLWDGNGDFIDFLAKSYSPLTIYWAKNVRHFYRGLNHNESEQPITIS